MKTLLIIVVGAALWAAGCGGRDMESPPEKGSAVVTPGGGGEVAGQAASRKPEAAPAPAVKPGVEGEVTLVGKADAGAPPSGELSLDFGDGDRVEGTLVVGGASIAVRGIKEGSNLRLWAVSGGAEGEGSRRGTVWGKLVDGEASGELTLSGSGGEPVVKGRWKGKVR